MYIIKFKTFEIKTYFEMFLFSLVFLLNVESATDTTTNICIFYYLSKNKLDEIALSNL